MCRLRNEIISRLKFHLSESVYIKTSELIRYILDTEFKVKFSIPDSLASRSFLQNSTIFSKEKNPYLSFNEICKEKLIVKEEGELCHSSESKYKYDKGEARKLLKTIICEKNRILLYEKLLLLFPDYLDINMKMINIIMNESGFISIPQRYYLAIMAVSTVKCEYMLRTLEEIFLSVGGDEKWLVNGLNSVPEKIKRIAKINNILAHQPWKLQTSDIIVNDVLMSRKSTKEIIQTIIGTLMNLFMQR